MAYEVNGQSLVATSVADRVRAKMKPWLTDHRFVLACAFLLHVDLVFPVFFPSLSEIGPWDESVYINRGRTMAAGDLPEYAQKPVVALFYVLTYLPVQHSPHWLVHSCSLGRIAFFGLLWVGSYLVARRLSNVASPWIMVGLLVTSPVLPRVLNNGSIAMFAVLSTFALWQFLSFCQTRQTKHLWLISLLLGLGALSRNEGPLLFVVFLGLTVVLACPMKRLGACFVACAVPFAVVTGGYIVLHGLVTGDFALGTARRSYNAFEQGHGWANRGFYRGRQEYVEGQVEARRLFGTPEENQRSVLTAISRNPRAYFERIPKLANLARWYAVDQYGRGLGLICFLLAFRGMIELARQKSYLLLSTLLLWSGYAVMFILIVFAPSYLLMPFIVVFALASVGITATLSNLDQRVERCLWSVVLLALAVVGFAKATAVDLAVACMVWGLGLWLAWSALKQYRIAQGTACIGCLLLLSVALTVEHFLPAPRFRHLGDGPEEKAAAFLAAHVKSGAPVGAWGPKMAWAAKLTHVRMNLRLRHMKSGQDVLDWIAHNRVEAIYADPDLRKFEPEVWKLIEAEIGKSLEVVFRVDGGKLQVLRPVGDLGAGNLSQPEEAASREDESVP